MRLYIGYDYTVKLESAYSGCLSSGVMTAAVRRIVSVLGANHWNPTLAPPFFFLPYMLPIFRYIRCRRKERASAGALLLITHIVSWSLFFSSGPRRYPRICLSSFFFLLPAPLCPPTPCVCVCVLCKTSSRSSIIWIGRSRDDVGVVRVWVGMDGWVSR